MHATIAKLTVNWLTIIPFTIHPYSHPHRSEVRQQSSIDDQSSYSVIANYNTIAHASSFLQKTFARDLRRRKATSFADVIRPYSSIFISRTIPTSA